jgi:Flp pilus assembly protein TadG
MIATTRCRRLWGASTGTAALEFAAIAPVFMLMFLGAVDFGRLLWTQSTLQQATEAAARCASFNTSTCDNATDTQSYAANQTYGLSSVSSSNFTANLYSTASPYYCDTNSSTPGNLPGNKVAASYTFTFIVPVGNLMRLFGASFTGSMTLSAQSCYPVQSS